MAEIDDFFQQLLADRQGIQTHAGEGLQVPYGRPHNLSEQCVNYEGKLIKHALTLARGSIPGAALLLTLTSEHLTVILELRHRDLLAWAERESRTIRTELNFTPIVFHDEHSGGL
jgi:hypothetical protein